MKNTKIFVFRFSEITTFALRYKRYRSPAGVVKLVDTLDLGSSAFKSVKVRVLSPAH